MLTAIAISSDPAGHASRRHVTSRSNRAI